MVCMFIMFLACRPEMVEKDPLNFVFRDNKMALAMAKVGTRIVPLST